jgi:hypothetical protein
MKIITQQSRDKFLAGKPFNKGNMQVRVLWTTVELRLHGNMIAYYLIDKPERIVIQNCGWFSNTTKERLNALPNVHIKQKNWNWYLNGEEWNGTIKEIFI